MGGTKARTWGAKPWLSVYVIRKTQHHSDVSASIAQLAQNFSLKKTQKKIGAGRGRGAVRLISQPCDSSWKRQSLEAESLQAWRAAGSCSHRQPRRGGSPGKQTQGPDVKWILFNELLCSNSKAAESHHSFQDDIVGVHNEVKPLLLPRQLALVSDVRSATMVLHYLTHATTALERERITEGRKVADGAAAILLQMPNQTRFGLQRRHKSVENLEGAKWQKCLCVFMDIWQFQTTTTPKFLFTVSRWSRRDKKIIIKTYGTNHSCVPITPFALLATKILVCREVADTGWKCM